MIDTSILALVRTEASLAKLDYATVCAVIEQESGWNFWAIRYEPLFMSKYVAPLYAAGKFSASEAWARAYSWGGMQLMGQVAREMGFTGPFLSQLCDPSTGIHWGCVKLAKCFDGGNGDPTLSLQRWNGGGNPAYAPQVLARVPHYQ